jgi:hypothetical protein
VVTEHLLGAVDHLGVGVDLLGLADHPHEPPDCAERGRVERCRHPQLPEGHPVRVQRRRIWGRGVEDRVAKPRQPLGVDGRVILIERHDVVGDQPVQRQRLRDWVVAVLCDGVEQVHGT